MNRPRLVKRSGPYVCRSFSSDGQGVRIEIYPAYPQYNGKDWLWVEHRYKGEGGGPGIFTAIDLAEEIERFLNAPYSDAQIEGWRKKQEEVQKLIREQG